MPFEVLATLICDFGETLMGRYLASTGIGPQGDIVALSLSEAPERGKKQNYAYRLHQCVGGIVRHIDIAPGPGFYHHVQPLPEGRFLLVHARSGGNNNAFVLDAEGFCVEQFCLGDAIEDVQVGRDGSLWVSHFDEAMGSYLGDGLRCLDASHKVVFDFNQAAWKLKTINVDTICDCYMLNVASDREVWLCPYTGFSIYHLRDFQLIETFEAIPEMCGSHTFAISRGRLLFVGGYHFKKRVFWHDLHQVRTVELSVVGENDEPLSIDGVQCRSDAMLFWRGTQVHRVGVEEVWPP